MTIRVTQGAATVVIGGELEDFVRGLVQRSETATIRALRESSDKVVRDAESAWYGPGGVQRRTGQSGDIDAVESVDVARGELRVSVGSTDDRRAGNKPVPVFVHRPRRTSMLVVDCTPDEWYALPKSLRRPWRTGPSGKVAQRAIANPKASDGKFLLQELVKGPMRKEVKRIAAELGEDIARGK